VTELYSSGSLCDVMMTLAMEGEVIGPRENPAAGATRKRLVSSVLAEVTSQLVGPCEPPLTTFPRASERTLTYATSSKTLLVRR